MRQPRWPMLVPGLVTWAIALVPALWRSAERHLPQADAPWVVAALLFVPAFLATLRQPIPWRRRALLVTQGVAAVLCATHAARPSMLVAVVAAEAGFLWPAGEAIVWVIVQTTALAWTLASTSGWAVAATTAGGAFAIELALASAGLFAQRERALRTRMAAVNAELIATREIAAETTRMAERLQIARELHDSLGHQLTALRIQLEVARHVAEGAALEPICRSSDLAKRLLVELREVVAGARADSSLDLARSIELLAAGIPAPRIRVTMSAGFVVRDHLLAHTLFRCVQESLTNVIRHSGAKHVSIDLSSPPGGGHTVTVEDDGTGVAHLRPGYGLRGLEERLTRLGGRLEIHTSPGAGFTLQAFLPARPGAPEIGEAWVDASAPLGSLG